MLAKLDGHATVQPLLHPYAATSQSGPDIAARDLIDLPFVPDRIVGGHDPFFHQAQDRRQLMLGAQGSVRIRAARRQHREGLVPLRQVFFLQIGLRRFPTVGPHQAQPFYQTVLGRAEEAFDAALRLRRVRRDPANPQFPQGPPDLRPLLFYGLIRRFHHRPVHREQTALVGVKLHRPTPTLQVSPQHAQVLLRAVLLHKTRISLAAGVINHRYQVQPRSPAFQPVVHRGVPLNYLSPTTPARPPHVYLLDPPPLPPPQPGSHQPLPQRLFAHLHRVLFSQVFTGQRGAKVAVPRLYQLQRPSAQTLRQAPVRHLSTQAMHHSPIALLLDPNQQSSHLPIADP